MRPLHPAGPAIGGIIALVAIWLSLRQRRRQRLLDDLPTSRTAGIFVGLVELTGTAESEAPLISHLAEAPCVHYTWLAEEHWRRTRVEHYTDSKGKSQTRVVTETGWDTVASGGETSDFYLQDETGVVLVRPDGATIEPVEIFCRSVSRDHPLYHGKAPEAWVIGSTGERRFTERAVPLHARLYVVGTARERRDIVAPEIVSAPGAEFILSCRTEAAIKRGLGLGSWAAWLLGLVALPAGLLIASGSAPHEPALLRLCWLAAGGSALLWLIGWIWMVHNSLVGLRERVRQAWSQVDVQLKRRHDLIPALAATVSSLGAHERDVQTALAALRAQSAATPPGTPGADPAGLSPTLRAVIERHPELVAREGFASLHAELVATEQRIALARAYYNDIATHYATRLESVPDRFVARLRALRPAPLLTAEDFERTPVSVRLATR